MTNINNLDQLSTLANQVYPNSQSDATISSIANLSLNTSASNLGKIPSSASNGVVYQTYLDKLYDIFTNPSYYNNHTPPGVNGNLATAEGNQNSNINGTPYLTAVTNLYNDYNPFVSNPDDVINADGTFTSTVNVLVQTIGGSLPGSIATNIIANNSTSPPESFSFYDLFTNNSLYTNGQAPGVNGTVDVSNLTTAGLNEYYYLQSLFNAVAPTKSFSDTLNNIVANFAFASQGVAFPSDFLTGLQNLFAGQLGSINIASLTPSQQQMYLLYEAVYTETTGNQPPFDSSSLAQIIQSLKNSGFISATLNETAYISFDSLVSGFLTSSSYANLGSNATPSDYVQAFEQYADNLPGLVGFDPNAELLPGINQLIADTNSVSGGLFTSSLSPGGTTLTSGQQTDLINTIFGQFLQYASTLSNISGSPDFYTSLWSQNAAALVALNYPTEPIDTTNTINDQQPSPPQSALSLYQDIWNTFEPNNPGGFIPTLLQYIQSTVASGQPFNPLPTSLNFAASVNTSNPQTVNPNTLYSTSSSFTPSGALYQWFTVLSQQATTQRPLSTAGGNFDQVQILFDIYSLLLKMLNSLQIMTASQAERQLFYTAYESAYTTSEAGIQYVNGATGALQGYNSGNVNVLRRSDTSQMNTQFTSSVQAFRSEIESLAQQQNSAVSQGQESVSQQVNLAQSFIQESNTILQSMWH